MKRQTDGRTDKVSYKGACYAPKKGRSRILAYYYIRLSRKIVDFTSFYGSFHD